MPAIPAPGSMTIFDRRAVRRHRDRAAATLPQHDFLLREVGERLIERLDDIRRSFPAVLDLGCHRGDLAGPLTRRPDIETLVQADLSARMVAHAGGLAVAADEEALPFADASFDLVASLLSLHWVNDLPGALVQIRRALKPDGLFLAALLGGRTLVELRDAFARAEMAIEGGASPRVSPFADVRDLGNLLQRAGFALPVVDAETITVMYASPLALLADLRGMGEANAVIGRRPRLSRRATLFDAMARYQADHAGDEGRVAATFQVIYLLGWAPHPSQPQPLKRGSGKVSLADALGSVGGSQG